MEHIALTLRLTVGFVCLVAVLGKLRGWRSFAASVELVARSVPVIRSPARFAKRWTAPMVAAELAVLVLVPWPRTAVAGSGLAVIVFGALTAAVGFAVARGTAAPCACFGRIARTLGPVHVVRNAVLTSVALIATAASLAASTGPSTAMPVITPWLIAPSFTAPTAATAPVTPVGAVVCAVVAAAAAQLLVHWDTGATSATGQRPMPVLPPPGTPVPTGLGAMTVDGSPLLAADFAHDEVVVVFLTSPCTSCRAALPAMRAALTALPASGPRPVAVLSGTAGDWPEYRAALSPPARVVENGDDVAKGHGVADVFGVRAFPSVLVISGGVVRRAGMSPSEVLPLAAS